MSNDWIRLDDVECGDAWIDEDDAVGWRTNRLFDPAFPVSTSIETDRVMGPDGPIPEDRRDD